MNNKLKILLLLLISFIILPTNALAVTFTATHKWSNVSNETGLSYNTKGWGSTRNTDNIAGFTENVTGSPRWYCVEPGITFSSSTDYNIGSTAPTKGECYNWTVSETDEREISKVLSCSTNDDNYSVVATQAIVWELVTEERDVIKASDIFSGKSGAYEPVEADGSKFSSNNTSLYERITKNAKSELYDAYKSVLRCAARFNITPNFAETTQKDSKASPKALTSYDDETQTFSKTFSITSKLQPNLLKYYTIDAPSGVTVKNNKNSITVTTNKQILKENAVTITLKYSYKDDAKTKLNNFGDMQYATKCGKQSLARGARTFSSYLTIYTGPKPTYQARVKKVDEDGNAMKGIKITFYSDSKLTNSLGTKTTDASGYATMSGLSKIGTYYAKETSDTEGYVTDNRVSTITVNGDNKTGTSSYGVGKLSSKTITQSVTDSTMNKSKALPTDKFMNTYNHLRLLKYSVDSSNKKVKMNDKCSNPSVDGPVFEVKQGNNKVCVKKLSNGTYTYDSLATSCASPLTSEIETCNGEFDISKIPAGTYVVSEISTPDGMTLPKDPNQTVTIAQNKDVTAVTMINGVTGVLFMKITEDGTLLNGGKFALQKKDNGIYKDILLTHDSGMVYKYSSGLTEESSGATYLLDTSDGMINVLNLPTGEYRFIEKQAPDGYDAIADKDSTAKFTISDKDTQNNINFYQVQLINQKTKVEGSSDKAELVVTIKTGRSKINYSIVFGVLAILLIAGIIIRKKMKK